MLGEGKKKKSSLSSEKGENIPTMKRDRKSDIKGKKTREPDAEVQI